VVSAAETGLLVTVVLPVSLSGETLPLRSWMWGVRSVRLVVPHPMEIITGRTWPLWTMLVEPSTSGGLKAPSYTLTDCVAWGEVADTPPSLSVACASTVWVPQVEK
jgi:hypothetical protein